MSGAGSKKTSMPAAAQKAHIPLVSMKRHHRLFTVRDKFLSIDKLSRCPLRGGKEPILFQFPREILEVEKWYFAGLVSLRSLALKLGHSLSPLHFDPSNKQKSSVGVTLIPNPHILFYFNLFLLIFSKLILSLAIVLNFKIWTILNWEERKTTLCY